MDKFLAAQASGEVALEPTMIQIELDSWHGIASQLQDILSQQAPVIEELTATLKYADERMNELPPEKLTVAREMEAKVRNSLAETTDSNERARKSLAKAEKTIRELEIKLERHAHALLTLRRNLEKEFGPVLAKKTPEMREALLVAIMAKVVSGDLS